MLNNFTVIQIEKQSFLGKGLLPLFKYLWSTSHKLNF
jgi:hypothetical protein